MTASYLPPKFLSLDMPIATGNRESRKPADVIENKKRYRAERCKALRLLLESAHDAGAC